MEQDLNGTNFSDTTLKPDNSTIREERFLISRVTRMKKEPTLELILPRMEEFNRDGQSDILMKCKPKLRMVPDQEDSKSVDHSTLCQDCGCREFSLITATTMLT